MLNLTRLHLGIAHESQFQGLGIMGPKKRTVAFPVSSSAILQPTIPVPLRGCYALEADFGTGGKDPRFRITPERDEAIDEDAGRVAHIVVVTLRRPPTG